ncbi:MAG: RnfABCDGE type electron transport complex subunit G [Bacteroidales bacterium]
MAKESTLKNMLVTLTLICLVSSAILVGVYSLTKDPIDKANKTAEIAAIARVVPKFETLSTPETIKVETNSDKVAIVYKAFNKDQELIAYAIKITTSKGFGGNVTVMVGITPDGNFFNTKVLAHTETPGLGAKMDPKQSNFSEQFKGKDPKVFKLAPTKDGGDVDAITAATISSRAYCDALQMAVKVFNNLQNEKSKEVNDVE